MFTSDRRRAGRAADPPGRPLSVRVQSLSIVPRATLPRRMRPWCQTAAGTVGLATRGSFLQSVFSVMRRAGFAETNGRSPRWPFPAPSVIDKEP